jgi:hypothetical protein
MSSNPSMNRSPFRGQCPLRRLAALDELKKSLLHQAFAGQL